MGWTIRVLGFNSWQGLGIFLFTTASRMALGPTQPPIQWAPGALSLGVKLTILLHPVPKSRMCGVIPALPQYIMAWCLVKHRDNFIFTFFTFITVPNPVCKFEYSQEYMSCEYTCMPVVSHTEEIHRREITQLLGNIKECIC
jgi:hypothetical protein